MQGKSVIILLLMHADTVPSRLPSSSLVNETTSFSAVIEWGLSDVFVPSTPEIFTVIYGRCGTDLDVRSHSMNATEKQTYSTQLNLLDPGTTYFYRIESRNGFETVLTPMNYTFSTNDSSKQ